MEGVSARVYTGARGYWKSRGYERLGGTSRRYVELAGSGSTRRRRFWRIKIGRKLKLKLRFSAKKFFIGLRDAYVNMMLKLASSRVVVGCDGGDGFGGFWSRPLKEYDEKVIIEVYKSIVKAQDQLVHRGAARIGSGVASFVNDNCC